MPRQLKVFRMPIGFEDAYVAAPSRKAALQAWGTSHDQFARGLAEEVTDPALMAEPLARPGEVIRKSRGDLASQLKALPPRPGKKPAAAEQATPRSTAAKRKPAPRRDKVDAAEAALEAARARHAGELTTLDDQLKSLEQRLAAERERQRKEEDKLVRKRDEAREAFARALAAWSE